MEAARAQAGMHSTSQNAQKSVTRTSCLAAHSCKKAAHLPDRAVSHIKLRACAPRDTVEVTSICEAPCGFELESGTVLAKPQTDAVEQVRTWVLES